MLRRCRFSGKVSSVTFGPHSSSEMPSCHENFFMLGSCARLLWRHSGTCLEEGRSVTVCDLLCLDIVDKERGGYSCRGAEGVAGGRRGRCLSHGCLSHPPAPSHSLPIELVHTVSYRGTSFSPYRYFCVRTNRILGYPYCTGTRVLLCTRYTRYPPKTTHKKSLIYKI